MCPIIRIPFGWIEWQDSSLILEVSGSGGLSRRTSSILAELDDVVLTIKCFATTGNPSRSSSELYKRPIFSRQDGCAKESADEGTLPGRDKWSSRPLRSLLPRSFPA